MYSLNVQLENDSCIIYTKLRILHLADFIANADSNDIHCQLCAIGVHNKLQTLWLLVNILNILQNAWYVPLAHWWQLPRPSGSHRWKQTLTICLPCCPKPQLLPVPLS